MQRWKEEISQAVKDTQMQVVAWRRHFHQHPELSFEEFDTSDFVAAQLEKMGYAVKRNIGGTGLMADLYTGKPGPAIAFRADMDALPMMEETDLPFTSEKAGIMHGCGHDGHMAILLGTAKVLKERSESLTGTIRFLFEAGEEANGGARCMIEDGALQDPPIEAVFGLHMMPDLPVGTIGLKAGHMSATDDTFIIRVHGKSAHSSEPELGVNAIMAAAHVVTALDSVLSNNIGPFQIATFSICQFHGGEAVNVIPDSVEMQGMIRCVEKADKFVIRQKMEQIVDGTCKALGAEGEVEFIPGYPSVNNDEALTRLVIDAAASVLKTPEDVYMIARPHLGSEDFAHFQEDIPGVMFMLGCAQENEETGTLHSTVLNINEESFLYGMLVFAAIAFAKNGKQ